VASSYKLNFTSLDCLSIELLELSGCKGEQAKHNTDNNMNKLYIITAEHEGTLEELYCSYDRSDCVYEKDAEKDQWKEQGYKKVKITSRMVEEKPDPEVYDSAVTGELKPQIEKVMNDTLETLDTDIVGDVHEITKDDDGNVVVCFADEEIDAVLAGYIPCKAYDKLEANINKLGYTIIDSDGSKWILDAK